MTVDSFQIAFLSVTLLLPGYIASLVLSARRARRREATEIEFFRWLALGAVCNAPWIMLSFLAAGDELRSDETAWAYAVDHRWWFVPWWTVAMFLWPWAVGWVLGRVQDRWIRSQSPRSGATAWQAKFIEVDKRHGDWILVLLNDGGWVAGAFADGSYASIEPDERDVYISRVHFTSFDEQFPGLGSEGGMLIPASEIRLIRFWD